MIAAIADTHAAVWYLSADPRLSEAAKRVFEAAIQQGTRIGVSAITLVEMIYLIEKGRIPSQQFEQLGAELAEPGSVFVEVPVELPIARALSQVNVKQIPDMPDRTIAATALHFGVPIISRDRLITLSGLETIW